MPLGASRLALLHLHQRSAPLDARESLAAIALAAPSGPDLVVLATCHRVELYAALPDGAEPREWFAARLDDGDGVIAHAELRLDRDVALHLFRVACGLDSAVLGEGQILGQVRRTFDAARRERRLDPLLADLFRHALHVARAVRLTTPLGSVRRSVGSLAVDEGIRLLADPRSATALVIGAGEVGKLAARALRRRVGTLLVANRDLACAVALTADIDAEAVPLDRLDDAFDRADLVVSAADTRGQLLTAERLARRVSTGPLVLLDIAVPRSVDFAGRTLPSLMYRDVDDLARGPAPELGDALAVADARCAEEASAFMARRRERAASDVIRALHERAERIRRAQLERALAKLGGLDARDRGIVEALSSRITNALLHTPTVSLRRAPEHAPVAVELFGIRNGS